jgi:hypothetical protein
MIEVGQTGGQFAVSRDGQRFLVVVRQPGDTSQRPLTVVLNWPETIRH